MSLVGVACGRALDAMAVPPTAAIPVIRTAAAATSGTRPRTRLAKSLIAIGSPPIAVGADLAPRLARRPQLDRHRRHAPDEWLAREIVEWRIVRVITNIPLP